MKKSNCTVVQYYVAGTGYFTSKNYIYSIEGMPATIKAGDVIIILDDTVSSDQLKVVKVVETHVVMEHTNMCQAPIYCKKYIGKADVKAYFNKIELPQHKQELDKLLDKKLQQMQRVKLFEQLMSDDTEASAMVAEYKDIVKKLEK